MRQQAVIPLAGHFEVQGKQHDTALAGRADCLTASLPGLSTDPTDLQPTTFCMLTYLDSSCFAPNNIKMADTGF